jgi:hypothetical protein
MINTGSAVITSLPTYSIQFDGTSQSVSTPSNAAFALPGDFTIEGWFYKTTTWYFNGNTSLIEGTSTGAFSFYVNGNGTTATLRSGPQNTSSYSLGALPAMTTNTWYHIAFTRKTNSARGYINGTPLGVAVADSNSYVTTAVTMSWVNDGYFPGYITNFRATIGDAKYDSNNSTVTAPSIELTSDAYTRYLMLGAAVTTDSSGIQTVTNNNGVTLSATKPF